MGILFSEFAESRGEVYRHTMKAWELLHEEAGFEDLGFEPDRLLSDLDGFETHIRLHEIDPNPEMRRH